MAVGYGMPGGRFCWLAVQRALELSAALLFGSGKGERLHGTEVTLANGAAREMQARLKLHAVGACCSCMLLIQNEIVTR
jgi:hypothetical protein